VLNSVVLIGRLTADPSLRYTPAGIAVATFTLAVDRNFKNAQGEKETDFIPIVVWRKQAENCANHIGKGSLIAIEGRIQVRTYETNDGQRRWATEIIAENVRFLDFKKDKQENSESSSFGGEEVSFSDENIPF